MLDNCLFTTTHTKAVFKHNELLSIRNTHKDLFP